MNLRPALAAEFDRRRARNPRYSWRAFARDLDTHHTTLREIVQGTRRLTPRAIQALGARLGLTSVAISDASLRENVDALQRLVDGPRFRPDSRWLAMQLGLSVDDVNRALQYALWQRVLIMDAGGCWRWVR